MALIDPAHGLVADPWVRVAAAGPLPPGGDVSVPPGGDVLVPPRGDVLVPPALAAAALDRAPGAGRVGLELDNTIEPDPLRPILGRVALIAVRFPAFSDGRGFTLARRLRSLGYLGRLRASGALIPDQFALALDVGFDEVEIDEARLERQPLAQWQAALASQRVAYQPDRPHRLNILAARHAPGAPCAGGNAPGAPDPGD